MEENKKSNLTTEISDCKKGAKTLEELYDKFDADDICMKCENIRYGQGVISCKYAKV